VNSKKALEESAGRETGDEQPSFVFTHRLVMLAGLALLLAFVLTGPWKAGGYDFRRLSFGLTLFWVPIALLLVASRNYRVSFRRWLDSEQPLTVGARLVLAAMTLLFCIRVSVSKFLSFEINAWDFSLFFDRPLEQTLHGRFLFSEFLGSSTIAAHADFALLLFFPLYLLKASPWWLVLGQGLIVAAAVLAAFRLFRNLLHDDLAAAALAGAFLFDKYTAKCLQYVFHIEVLYLLLVLVLLIAAFERRVLLFSLTLALTIAVKQDAIIALTGVALTAMLMRRWRYAVASIVTGFCGFGLDYFIVMPHFAANALHPWYSWYWSSFGATPLRAFGGMLTSPMLVTKRLLHSATADLLWSALLTPLAGVEWLAGALPGLLLFGVSDFEKVSRFELYYAAAIVPFVFVAAAAGLRRVASRSSTTSPRLILRLGAIIVLIWSGFYGSGYHFERSRPERHWVFDALRRLPAGTKARVQGAAYPHAGYDSRWMVLGKTPPGKGEAVLVCQELNPYPRSRGELDTLVQSLRRSLLYDEVRHGPMSLFVPRSIASVSPPPDGTALR